LLNHFYNKPRSKKNLFLRLIVFCGDLINTFLKLILIAFSSPIQTAKLISFKKLIVLLKAIKYESPQQISEGFRRQLINGNNISSVLKNIYPPYDKKKYLEQKQKLFYDFLQSTSVLDFKNENPVLSIILVFYNKAELSFACLKSIQKYVDISYEIIIIDNNSTDDTSNLLDKIKGAAIIRNSDNQHFNKACNQAIPHIKGRYTLFLNNDTELLEESIRAVYQTIETNKNCGAVGGKIILPNGKLQEAGSIIWNDGSCLGYGRDQEPYLPEFNFKRAVDYCSGAFLLTKTNLFKKYGGFDSRFEPAYYEETDYCLWLQENGMEVIYDPKAVIRHFEFASGLSQEAIKLHKKNQKIFFEKNKTKLRNHFASDFSNILNARFSASNHTKKKILYIDDRVPHINLGAGFPRSNSIIQCIKDLGFQLSIYPLNYPYEDNWDEVYRDIDPFIEVIKDSGVNGFKQFIKSRENYFDIIWISRPHNMQAVGKLVKEYAPNCKIIYDAEAIFADREISKKYLKDSITNKKKAQILFQKEIRVSEMADTTIAVCKTDAEKFEKYGAANVCVLGHYLKTRKSNNNFENRKGLLFVGNLDDEASPNTDSIIWFSQEVLPKVKRSIPNIVLNIIGSCKSKNVRLLNSERIRMLGQLNELDEFYDNCRLFIAPTRFAAGIPYKIHEAAANGLPVIATDILGKQLGWKNKETIILSELNSESFADAIIKTYNDQELWERIQKNAYQEIEKEFSYSEYKDTIADILETNYENR